MTEPPTAIELSPTEQALEDYHKAMNRLVEQFPGATIQQIIYDYADQVWWTKTNNSHVEVSWGKTRDESLCQFAYLWASSRWDNDTHTLMILQDLTGQTWAAIFSLDKQEQ